ncbi:MAG: GGDEF domain-containing protein [Planctomycetes bacterium]|nr:GGDEF domain-containing protein [Planctomycetota bacterium]
MGGRLVSSLIVGLKSGLECMVSYWREAYDPVRQDRLTRVYNRNEFERRRRRSDGWSLVLVDLDDFKAINDSRGHGAGDLVLAAVASQIRRGVGDEVYRIGGEEFAVLVHAPLLVAVGVARRIRRAVAALQLPGSLRVTASVGVARQAPGEDPDACFRRTDTALYRAKRRGKNRVVASVARTDAALPA